MSGRVIIAALCLSQWLALDPGKAQTRTENRPAAPSFSKTPEWLFPAQLPDGRLIAVVTRTKDNGHEVAARYSSDGGYSWSEAESLTMLPKEPGNWSLHNILLDRRGELHLIYTNDAHTASARTLHEKRYDIWHLGSTEGRKKWPPPRQVRQGYYGSMLSVIELDSGRIVLPICYLTNRTWSKRGEGFDAFTYMGQFSSSIMYSDDRGETWHQSGVEFKAPTPIINADGMIEPIVLQLKDGRVWTLIRTQLGRFFESFSADGSAWSRPRPTRIVSSDSPPALTRLKDGRIVMLWNNALRHAYANGGRHVLHAAISEDEGRTWRGYREIARDPRRNEPPPPTGDHGVSYTIPVLTKEKKIIVPMPIESDRGYLLLHLDPEWLYETAQKTDFSSGFDAWSTFGTRGPELLPHPGKGGARVLSLRKPDAEWPAAAAWNFPLGRKGQLRLKLLLNPGFQGGRLSITDHFSVPFDPEAEIYNLYNLEIGANGALGGGKKIEEGRWHDLLFQWDCTKRECRVLMDRQLLLVLSQSRESPGACYLRLTSSAEQTDSSGMLLESVEADVSTGWAEKAQASGKKDQSSKSDD